MHVLFLDNTDTVEASVKKLGEHLIQISGAEVNLSGFHLLNDAAPNHSRLYHLASKRAEAKANQ